MILDWHGDDRGPGRLEGEAGGIDEAELLPALAQLGMKTDGSGAQKILQKYAGPGSRRKSLMLPDFERLVKDLEQFQGATSPIRKTAVARTAIDPKVRARACVRVY